MCSPWVMDGNRTSAANEPWDVNGFRNRRKRQYPCHFTISATTSLAFYVCMWVHWLSTWIFSFTQLQAWVCSLHNIIPPRTMNNTNKYWLGERNFCWLENKAGVLNPAEGYCLPVWEGWVYTFWACGPSLVLEAQFPLKESQSPRWPSTAW